MKPSVSNFKIQLAWHHFLYWLFWITLGAAATGDAILGGGSFAVVAYLFRDWRNAPYKDPVADDAGPGKRLMTVVYYLLGCVAIRLALFLLQDKPLSTDIWWFAVFAAAATTLYFTKPLPRPEVQQQKDSKAT